MKTHLLVSIGLATAMLGGSLALVGGGTIAVASSEDGPARKFAVKATKALAKRRAADAVTFAEQAVALAPRDAAYRALLGRAYLAAGRFASATQAFTDVLMLNPADAKAALNLATNPLSVVAQAGLGEDVDVTDLEIHAFFKQDETAAVRVGAGRSGIQHHHGGGLLRSKEAGGASRHKTTKRSDPFQGHCAGDGLTERGETASRVYFTSFQYAAFRRQAMNVKIARKISTPTPMRVRWICMGSAIHCR